MDTATIEVTAEDEIRGLFKSWANATCAKDIDAIMSHYAPDILSFDAISQLQFKGADAYRKHWQACLAMCPGAMIFEIHDLNITAGDGVAFGHCLLRCGATSEDGEEKSRVDGKWGKIGGTRVQHNQSGSQDSSESAGSRRHQLTCRSALPPILPRLRWMRVTVCYRKTNGRWMVVHEHFSAPFDVESGKALLDLEP